MFEDLAREPAFRRVVVPEATENVTCAPAPEPSERPSWHFWWSRGESPHGACDPCEVARFLEAHRG